MCTFGARRMDKKGFMSLYIRKYRTDLAEDIEVTTGFHNELKPF